MPIKKKTDGQMDTQTHKLRLELKAIATQILG